MSIDVLAPGAATTSRRHTTGRWVIDPDRTIVETRVRALGLPVYGRFASATGLIDVPRDITRSNVTVTVRSDTFETGSVARDRRARGGGFLDAHVHPTLSFSASGLRPIMETLVTADGDRPLWWLAGEVTARGVTRPVSLALGVVRHHDDGRALEFNATARIRRSEFGAVGKRALIGDVIDITVRGWAHREPADG